MAHPCHATGCSVEVPPEMFTCRRHWFALPLRLRNRIWAAYRVGQCDDLNPSRTYCEAAKAAVIYLAERDLLTPDTKLYDIFLADEDIK